MKAVLVLAAAMLAAAPAAAADLRDLCADRPGLDTPACTVDAGHVQIEMGLADWTHQKDADSLTDSFITGDLLARVGVGPSTELRFGWTAYGRERDEDRAGGAVQRFHGTGDIMLGIKQNIASPDGSGFSVAVAPSVTLPVGRSPIGNGTWSAGLIVPISWEIVSGVQVQLTPEADAAADKSGDSRHLAIGATAGLNFALTSAFSLDLEVQAMRDRDPTGHATTALGSASLAYQVASDWQIDLGGVGGLNRASPDIEAYCGIVRRF